MPAQHTSRSPCMGAGPRARTGWRLVGATALVAVVAAAAAGAPADDPGAFFETKIRPVLVQHCYQCHSAEAARAGKLKAALSVDSRAGLARGGESGAAVVPGSREGSLLLAALRHDGLEMPPTGKLSDAVIADFEAWIDAGAPDPRDTPLEPVAERVIDVEAGRQHWSYRRLEPVAVPAVSVPGWARNDVDRFVLARQEEAGVGPAPEASRATLARRLFFDLTGLPPSPEEMEAFLGDPAPDAYERLVDRLLASPRFGERWARHWLDTVRFGESGGYEFDGDREGAHHYRDWVIKAFNADLPYDEFLRMQVAGDLIRPGDYDATAATGFLVAGPYPGQVTAKTVEPIRYDQLDDMVATLGSSVLGMTIGCARCHDHKYDPITHRDYYAMIAALGKVVQRDAEIDPDPAATKRRHEAWLAERTPIAEGVERFRREELPGRVARWLAADAPRDQAADWLLLAPQSVKGAKATLAVEPGDVVAASGRLEADDTYVLTFRTHQPRVAALRVEALAAPSAPGGGPGTGKEGAFRLSTVKVTAAPLVAAADRQPVTPRLVPLAATFADPGFEWAKALDGDAASGWSTAGEPGRDQAAVVGFDAPLGFDGGTLLTVELKFEGEGHGAARLRVAAADSSAIGIVAPSAPQAGREVAALLETARRGGHDPAGGPGAAELARWFGRLDPHTAGLQAALDGIDAREPKPNLVKVYAATNGGWVITGNSQGVQSGSQEVFVLARGEVERKKGKADPGFVLAALPANDAERTLLSGPDAGPLADPRLGLARFLTDVERGSGPLAARVIVNRLWQHHFGRGLVATPNDFGTQGERPSHPQLLEWLAGRLVEERWSLKAMHRLLVTSATYRMSGVVDGACLAKDPDNVLLWHRRPVRLEGEAIRDALLAVSGTLDATMYGRAGIDVNVPRRSVYLTVKRSEPIGFLQVFDQPEPVQPVGARSAATVPTQALAVMNAPLVRSAAESLARGVRTRLAIPPDDPAKPEAIDACFMAALARRPSGEERDRFVAWLAARERETGADAAGLQTALADVCHLIFCLNEFVYVD